MKALALVLLLASTGCVIEPDRTGVEARAALEIPGLDFLPRVEIYAKVATEKGEVHAVSSTARPRGFL
jgi:hypothetical protein